MKKLELFKRKIVPIVLIFGILFSALSGALSTSAEEVTTSKLSMKYYNGSSWNSFSSVTHAGGITGIRLTTNSGAGYYLQYRTSNEGASGFYSYVNSNNTAANAYAGTAEYEPTQHAIQLLQIRVLKSSDNSVIRDSIVVMYRVKANGVWLQWVSNANPEWMESVKSKYSLAGALNTSASYAGLSGENIQGIEIHLYEEGDLVASESFSCDEISASMSYVPNGGSSWIGFSQKIEAGEIERLKIGTSASDFYLSYQTKNQGATGFYSEVSSKNSSAYAGAEGKPIQFLRIRAYTASGAKLVAGIVVMYRVKISTGWLNWVSNADPQYMRSVKSQYALDGGLDVNSSYAGKDGYNILGVEIRIFKGDFVDYDVTGLSGKEAKPTMSYATNTNSFVSFDRQTPIQASGGMISGIKIQTSSSKNYYLSYSVKAKDKGAYYSAVKSTENDYAGVIGNPIQELKISVYNKNGSAKLAKGIVVMYRAYTDRWLPWVSNADPEWMQSVKVKYAIEGALDTSSAFAGETGKNILAVEVRIFEENETTTSCSSKNAKKIQAPYIYQMNGYPTGCESASTVMALQKAGVNMTMKTFVNKYLPKINNLYGFDPNEYFGGDPTGSGMGCYAPAIMKALNKALAGKKQYGLNVTGKSLSYLCSQYIDNGIPIITWATMDMRPAKTVTYPQGLTWISPEHCLLLVGYDSTCYIFHDPMKSAYVHYIKADVETAYAALGKQAIVILSNTTASEPDTPTNTNPSTKPTASAQEYKKPNTVDKSNCADPIDLSTGSHIIENHIIGLFGGNKTNFTINYNSSQLVAGSIGVGWYHNFEKKLEVSGENIFIYDTPSVYSVYEKESDTVYNCTSKGKENFVLTLLSDSSYVLECNKNGKMYFDSNGKLTAIEDKNGFTTTLTYSENSITVNDAISGSLTLNLTDGLVTSVTDGIRTAELSYSEDYLISVKDVNGSMLHYTYNDNGRIESGSDDNGTVYFIDTYNTDGKIISQVDGSGNNAVTTFAYSNTESGTQVTVTNRNGDESIRLFNAYGLLTSYTDENGNTTTYTYDDNLNLISVTDANGKTESTVYNANNMPIRHTDKNGNITSYTYDSNNNVTDILYGSGGDINDDGTINILDFIKLKKHIADITVTVNSNSADINTDSNINTTDIILLKKHLLGISDIYIKAEHFAYNTRNQITSASNLEGVVTLYTYDSFAMPLTKTIGNRTERYTYVDGNLTETIDANGNKTTLTYNELNLISTKAIDISSITYTRYYEPNTMLPTDESTPDYLLEGSMLPPLEFDYYIERTEHETHITSYTYDNKGNVLSTTDNDGNTVSRTYDGNSLITSETDANGNTTYYSYNGNMKLLYVTFSDGTYIYYGYDGEDRLISVTDQRGNVSNTDYDPAGRVIRQSDAEKNSTEYSYDNVGNIIKTVNSDGGVILNTYDNNGNVLTSTDTLGNITTNVYDRFGRVISTTNAVGGVTEYTYSLTGNLLKVTDPLGYITEYTYDIYGNKLTATDKNGNTTTYTYDKNNNLLTVTDALGNITKNIYDEENRLLKTTLHNGAATTYTYDAAGRLTHLRDSLGNTVSYTYDPNGNVLTFTDAKGNVQTTNEYDKLNRVTSTVSASGNAVANTYDSTGNLLKVIDSLENEQRYTYDNLNRPIAVRDKTGSKTDVIYDAKGNILSVSLDGSSTEYTYDTNGNLLTETTSSGGLVSYTYNALNLKSEQTNAKNQTRTYSYDLAGRITGYTSPEGNASYTYDANGNILTATDQNGTVTRTFDALNRVTSYTDTQGKTIQYEYNSVGKLTKLTYPDNTAVNYYYDLNGNLVKVKDWANRQTEYTYDENNNITAVTKPDGSITETMYDTAGRVTYTAETVNDVIITGYEYTYDTEGRIIIETDLATNTKNEYTYDSLSRVTNRKITNLTNNTETNETYTYDANGNLLTSAVSTDSDTFVYDESNRLIEYNGQAVTYDADGNMLSANGLVLAYDSANRLLSAGANTYTYDIENTRVKNLCNDTETIYTYNINAELSQLLIKTVGDNVTKYVYGVGLIGEESNNSFKTYHFDYRGSTVAITDSTGAVTDTFSYDSYCNLLSRTGTTDTPFMYNGEYGVITDNNGLLYMRARYYSPELRRFINTDILMGDINNSPTLNRYAYANGNPVSNIDPFGMSADNGRGEANSNVFTGLEGLYNYAYGYYSYVYNKNDRINISNDAVMKYIIYKQYYEVGFANNLAWEAIAGPVDYDFINYMERHTEFKYLQGNVDFYDPSSGSKIDFTHLIGTLNANVSDRVGMGLIDDSLNIYAGWAGDLITLAGDAQKQKDRYPDMNVSNYVKNALGQVGTSFSQKDLIADVDAILLSDLVVNRPIYQAFTEYYSSNVEKRYTNFVAYQFNGIPANIQNVAEGYLSPNMTTMLFKKVFNSLYKKSIISDVANGFTNYIIENMR